MPRPDARLPHLPPDGFRLPDRYYGGICPYADRNRAAYRRWCSELTHLSEDGRERYVRQDVCRSASLAYPNPASYERALACNLSIFWHTAFDDFYGLGGAGETAALHDRCMELLHGARPRPTDSPPLRKAAELRSLCARLMPDRWLDRYAAAFDFYLQGVKSESVFRRERRLPTVAEARDLRLRSIGLFPCLRLVEMELDLPLPPDIADHPVIRRIERALTRISIWQNDAYSYRKESARPEEAADTVNLVLLLQHEGRSEDDAWAELRRIHDADVAEFTALADDLPDFGTRQADVQRYVEHLALVVSGVEVYYRDARRYTVGGDWVDEYMLPVGS
ncbi:terpene synthase family protein [Streptomyces albireticuli]|uniref:terpene synthase family protein n=1 Tax=Streptomyces albireticuli TaxID=1940 RepID=UPI00368B786E